MKKYLLLGFSLVLCLFISGCSEAGGKNSYESYSLGDDITLSDGTTWMVIKNTDSSESEVKLIATSNVYNNLTTQTGTDIFETSNSGTNIEYDSNDSNIWGNSTLKSYLDSTVKTRLEASLNTTISDITILGADELRNLGCRVVGSDSGGYSELTCNSASAVYSKIFSTADSWTRLHSSDSDYGVWAIGSDGKINKVSACDGYFGARVIITVSKSIIPQ